MVGKFIIVKGSKLRELYNSGLEYALRNMPSMFNEQFPQI